LHICGDIPLVKLVLEGFFFAFFSFLLPVLFVYLIPEKKKLSTHILKTGDGATNQEYFYFKKQMKQ